MRKPVLRIEAPYLRERDSGRIWTQICLLKNPFMLLKSFRIIQELSKTKALDQQDSQGFP